MKCLSIAVSNFFKLLELGDELSDQPVKPLRANLPVIVIFIAIFPISKYIKEDLQQIFKTILKVQPLITSKSLEISPWKPIPWTYITTNLI